MIITEVKCYTSPLTLVPSNDRSSPARRSASDRIEECAAVLGDVGIAGTWTKKLMDLTAHVSVCDVEHGRLLPKQPKVGGVELSGTIWLGCNFGFVKGGRSVCCCGLVVYRERGMSHWPAVM